ncbi:MAG: NYN domain-containing protein [Nitrospinales bacterium]
MVKKKKKERQKKSKTKKPFKFPGGEIRAGKAKLHGELVNKLVHVFVDDQNLFYGIVNEWADSGYRIDFGKLLIEVSKDSSGQTRGVKSAYIAGVIPDDDSFWKIAENQGFTVKRGYMGTGRRSKQDDAYLITEITSTLYEEEGPSTTVLVAGDADYVPPLEKALKKGWRNEIAFIHRGASTALDLVVHEYRIISPTAIQYGDFI